jgi:hypothetical protein
MGTVVGEIVTALAVFLASARSFDETTCRSASSTTPAVSDRILGFLPAALRAESKADRV